MGRKIKINNPTQTVEDIMNDSLYLHGKGYSYDGLGKLFGPAAATIEKLCEKGEKIKLTAENEHLKAENERLKEQLAESRTRTPK